MSSHLEAQRGLGSHGSAQHVTGGQMAQAVLILDAGALGALAAAGGTYNTSGSVHQSNK